MNNKPIDWNKPLQTRDGRKVRFVKELAGVGIAQPMAVIITEHDGREAIGTRSRNGNYSIADREDARDLINVPERIKREVWANIYAHDVEAGFISKAQADSNADENAARLACVKVVIECEHGQGIAEGDK